MHDSSQQRIFESSFRNDFEDAIEEFAYVDTGEVAPLVVPAGLTVVPEPVELIDEALAERHLALLGLEKVILCAYGSTNHYTPKRQGQQYDWEAISPARDWGSVRRDLQKPGTANLGFISCPGGTRVKAKADQPAEIFEVSTLVYEIDGMPKADQWELWKPAGLPEPTCVLDTGNGSLHVWYRLNEPVGVEEGRAARERLGRAIEKVLPAGVKTDKAMQSPHQPARLAGGIHPKTGERSRLVLEGGQGYDLAELMALCPELPPKETICTDGELFMESDEEPAKGEQFPELPLPVEVPLVVALPRKVQQLIAEGQRPGQGGRAVMAHSLSRSLQAAERCLEYLGQPFSGSALELFEQFVVASDLYGGDTDWAYEKHWETDDIGTGLMSELALRRALRSYAKANCGWRETYSLTFKKRAQPDWVSTVGEGFFKVTTLRTPELIIEEALQEWAVHEDRPLTSYQGRFLQYDPPQGYFKHLPANTLKRQVAGLMPLLWSENANGTVFRKHATDTKAAACVKWLGTVLHEDRMDLELAIAFSNGTYLLEQGELVEHSPDYRLTWSIVGDYCPGADCPPEFERFVCRSFGEEWLPVVQRVLRYLVDPTFKPSKLVMILGPSGSGKGTMERLIESLFPPSCISVITSGFSDINHPDKIRQFVRGKRLVAFPDLQGRQFGVGTIYSMTDGGLLTSRTLHESDAEEGQAFTGRVVICSTQPPSMEDAGNGMTRRMLVLKTLPPSGEPDLDLDEKLQAEKGAIVSWALRAERSEVKRMLTVGDAAGLLEAAGLEAEVQMDPIRSFIDQCLVPAESEAVPSDEALFTAFKLFCYDQNHKATTQRNFVNRLKAAVSHLRADERRSIPGTNGGKKTPKVFFGFSLRKGLMQQGQGDDPEQDLVKGFEQRWCLDRGAYGEGGLALLRAHRPEPPSCEFLGGLVSTEREKSTLRWTRTED